MHALYSFYRRIRLMSKQTKGMAKPPIETKRENLTPDGRDQELLYYIHSPSGDIYYVLTLIA